MLLKKCLWFPGSTYLAATKTNIHPPHTVMIKPNVLSISQHENLICKEVFSPTFDYKTVHSVCRRKNGDNLELMRLIALMEMFDSLTITDIFVRCAYMYLDLSTCQPVGMYTYWCLYNASLYFGLLICRLVDLSASIYI